MPFIESILLFTACALQALVADGVGGRRQSDPWRCPWNASHHQPGFADVDADADAQTSVSADVFRRSVVPELPVLLRVARRSTGDPRDAEDLVQETLLRGYRAIEHFDGRHPRAWLLTIQRHTWMDMNRRSHPHLLYDDDVVLSVPATGADGRSGASWRLMPRSTTQRSLSVLTTSFAAASVLAYHQHGGAGGNLAVLFVFLGGVVTAGWLLFSKLRWRNTVLVAVAGWMIGLAVTFGF